MIVWHRFRSDDPDTWTDHEPWPAEARHNQVLVYNSCDGLHVWSLGFAIPPGTHWADRPEPPSDEVSWGAPVGTEHGWQTP